MLVLPIFKENISIVCVWSTGWGDQTRSLNLGLGPVTQEPSIFINPSIPRPFAVSVQIMEWKLRGFMYCTSQAGFRKVYMNFWKHFTERQQKFDLKHYNYSVYFGGGVWTKMLLEPLWKNVVHLIIIYRYFMYIVQPLLIYIFLFFLVNCKHYWCLLLSYIGLLESNPGSK